MRDVVEAGVEPRGGGFAGDGTDDQFTAVGAKAHATGFLEGGAVQIRKHFRFEAAHLLPYHPGKCARLHGHSYRLEVGIRGPLHEDGPARGMVEDFDTIAQTVRERAIARLDHQDLNAVIENPTCERIAQWIWREISAALPSLDEIVLWETATSCAVLRKGEA